MTEIRLNIKRGLGSEHHRASDVKNMLELVRVFTKHPDMLYFSESAGTMQVRRSMQSPWTPSWAALPPHAPVLAAGRAPFVSTIHTILVERKPGTSVP